MTKFFNAVLYASAPELFDTAFRGSASGMLSCMGRLAGIVAPFAGKLADSNFLFHMLTFSLQARTTSVPKVQASYGLVLVVSGYQRL